MKKKFIISALLLSSLMIVGCGNKASDDDSKLPDDDQQLPDGGETTPEDKPTTPVEKDILSKTIDLLLPDSHLNYSDYSQDTAGEEGFKKEALKNDVFNDELFDTSTFEIYRLFGPSGREENPKYIKFAKGGGALTIGLNSEIIDTIESITINSFAYVRFKEYDKGEATPAFIPDRYKLAIDGTNFKDAPMPTGTSYEDLSVDSFTFNKEECSKLNNVITIKTADLEEDISCRCFLKSITINYSKK